MSDLSVSENATAEWKPLVVDHLDPSGTETDPQKRVPGDGSGSEFKMLYDNPEDPTGARRFVPLYAMADLDLDGTDGEDENPEPDEAALRQMAYEEGLVKGEEKGFAEGLKRATPVVARMQELMAEIDGLWQRLVKTHESQLIQLVGRVAEKVVAAHITLDHETIRRSIGEAFQTIPEPLEVTFEVNPKEVEYLETLKEDFFAQMKSLKRISLIPNPAVGEGGCRIKTNTGEVDATIESRLDLVCQSIIEVARGKASNGS